MAWFGETKVYFDGSHYIGIPHTTRCVKKKPQPFEELIIVNEENEEGSVEEVAESSHSIIEFEEIEGDLVFDEEEKVQNDEKNQEKPLKNSKKLTKKQYFNELYAKYIDLKKNERKKRIIKEMMPYFKNERQCEDFVNANFERKLRNLICRRTRMVRKANLAGFNYFCTFTYDSARHTEETFRKKLLNALSLFSSRKGWKYMGVWERAPKTKRLHFHGLFAIPEGTLPGTIKVVKSYSTRIGKVQFSYQSSYFNERFGRSDFSLIDGYENTIGNAISYIMEYMEKSGEKVVYSKRLYQYFISDILEDDILCRIGQEDKKLLLFDDFYCLNEGELIGKVCPEVINQMRMCN